MIYAVHLRERYIDSYDPPPRFNWIVEMKPFMGSRVSDYYLIIREWTEANSIPQDKYLINGVRIGFVDRGDALLFYIAHKV